MKCKTLHLSRSSLDMMDNSYRPFSTYLENCQQGSTPREVDIIGIRHLRDVSNRSNVVAHRSVLPRVFRIGEEPFSTRNNESVTCHINTGGTALPRAT